MNMVGPSFAFAVPFVSPRNLAMKIGVSSWSYNRPVRSGAMTTADVIVKAAETGFDAVELVPFEPPAGRSAESHAAELRQVADDANVRIVNYTVGADFLTGSKGDLDAEVERVHGELRVAAALGATGFRHDASTGFPADHAGPKSFDAALPRLVDGCRRLAGYGEQLGITTMVENHGLFCQDSDRLEKLACAVNHANFGILADLGNFICVDEHPGEALGRLLPYVRHVHAKDFHLKPGSTTPPGEGWNISRGGNYWRGAIIGHGDVPISQCLRLLKRAGYDGMLAIEFEGLEDPLVGTRIGLDNLRAYVAQQGLA